MFVRLIRDKASSLGVHNFVITIQTLIIFAFFSVIFNLLRAFKNVKACLPSDTIVKHIELSTEGQK